ncbi:MAG: HAMP domain-containing histidine kinase [Gemmatimonadetes bacterium]|nr:HAMP domain-containing histidine kinase [Gemmatimonadota bacterium]
MATTGAGDVDATRGTLAPPAPGPAGADPLADVADPMLRRAAERVCSAWPTGGLAEFGHVGIRAELARLLHTVDAPDLAARVEAQPAATLATWRRLLDLLRAELLGAPGDDAPASILERLRQLERARVAIEGAPTFDAAGILAGPFGLDLIIEIAHDLRSPLTSILFLADTLRLGHSGEVNEIQRRQLGIIYSAALGLAGTASDLIELAHRGDRLADGEPTPFSVAHLLDSVRQVAQPMAEEKGLELRIRSAEPDQRVGHPAAIRRILLNLTTNALKFTDEGFVDIHAHARGTDTIVFSVRDSGRGIEPDELETLFQPFRLPSQGDGHYFSGAGLGLAICRRLVRALGAELHVESTPGRGTRFHFELALPPVPLP